jgi:hypothetical protein
MHLRCHDTDVGSGGQQLGQLADAHRTGADEHDPAAAQVQEERQEREHK